jgi:hypothetical protein
MKKHNGSQTVSNNARWLHKSFIDTEPPLEKTLPAGPFQSASGTSQADLLLFVPRNEIGRTIDDLTGRYGYSHLAIDCGEIDVPTGRHVMIEATVLPGVHYAFLEEYGDRPSIRIPLHNIGIEVQDFCECVHSKIGEHFDDLKVISLGILDNPARQICSDLATVCLPDAMQEQIIRRHDGMVLHPLSIARHELSGSKSRLYVSPNGFAEYFCAPRGATVKTADQLVEPHIQESNTEELIPRIWKMGDTAMTNVWKMIKRPGVR